MLKKCSCLNIMGLFLVLTFIISPVSISAQKNGEEILSPDTPEHLNNDADRKRRLSIISENPDWPKRIVRFIREGEICLEMNEDQVEAAWSEPLQRSRAYFPDYGEVLILIYPEGSFSYSVVFLKKDSVIGWSRKTTE